MVTIKDINNVKSLKDVDELVQICRRCILYKTKISDVPGDGNSKASILFIGEAPGEKEDLVGKPFVGRAGKLLDFLFSKIKLKREDVFITNIVKHRPPQNRKPAKEEIKACMLYLKSQIEIINPKLIVLLGSTALEVLFPKKKISKEHGKFIRKENNLYLSLYHPAAAVYNAKAKNILIKDFKKINDYKKYL